MQRQPVWFAGRSGCLIRTRWGSCWRRWAEQSSDWLAEAILKISMDVYLLSYYMWPPRLPRFQRSIADRRKTTTSISGGHRQFQPGNRRVASKTEPAEGHDSNGSHCLYPWCTPRSQDLRHVCVIMQSSSYPGNCQQPTDGFGLNSCLS